jgi:hypothetical protein
VESVVMFRQFHGSACISNNGDFITVNSDHPVAKSHGIIRPLAHEFRHAWQIKMGYFVPKNYYGIWGGTIYNYVPCDTQEYSNLPWEKDAIKFSERFLAKVLRNLEEHNTLRGTGFRQSISSIDVAGYSCYTALRFINSVDEGLVRI